MQQSMPLRRFARYIFLVSDVYVNRAKAKEEVYSHLTNMRKSVIRMNLSYIDIDRLKEKIEKLIGLEVQYAKFFKPEDNENRKLRKRIIILEQELKCCIGEGQIENQRLSVDQIKSDLENIKSRVNNLIKEGEIKSKISEH